MCDYCKNTQHPKEYSVYHKTTMHYDKSRSSDLIRYWLGPCKNEINPSPFPNTPRLRS